MKKITRLSLPMLQKGGYDLTLKRHPLKKEETREIPKWGRLINTYKKQKKGKLITYIKIKETKNKKGNQHLR